MAPVTNIRYVSLCKISFQFCVNKTLQSASVIICGWAGQTKWCKKGAQLDHLRKSHSENAASCIHVYCLCCPPSITYFWLKVSFRREWAVIQAQISLEKEPFDQWTVFSSVCKGQQVDCSQGWRKVRVVQMVPQSTWCNWCTAIHRIVQYGAIQPPTWLAN